MNDQSHRHYRRRRESDVANHPLTREDLERLNGTPPRRSLSKYVSPTSEDYERFKPPFPWWMKDKNKTDD